MDVSGEEVFKDEDPPTDEGSFFDVAVDVISDAPVSEDLIGFSLEFLNQLKVPAGEFGFSVGYVFLDAVYVRFKRGERRLQIWFKDRHPQIVVQRCEGGTEADPYGVLATGDRLVASVQMHLNWVLDLTDDEGTMPLMPDFSDN
jgi:hypothetical protein